MVKNSFELLDIQKLLVKLHSYGVSGVVLKWLQNFFTGRTLQTKIDSSLSDIADLISGVVQGSGVGPLMFLIYINELVSVLEQYNIKEKLFADDVKMYLLFLMIWMYSVYSLHWMPLFSGQTPGNYRSPLISAVY